jgi:predicted Zn-dependent protease
MAVDHRHHCGTKRLSALVVAALLPLVAGCVTNKPTQQAQANPPLPPLSPRLSSVERPATREHSRLIAAFGGEYQSPAVEGLMSDVLARVVRASGDPSQSYKITILNSPTVNAFALADSNLYVTRGLLALANDTSEIAAVLAHEIGHVTANHAQARAELEQRSILVSRVVAEVLNDPTAGQMVRNESRVSLAGFSRAQELEADRIGIRTISKAGFDPKGASRFLAALGRNSEFRVDKTSSGRSDADFLSSHPTTPERLAQAAAVARSLDGAAGHDADRDRYLTAIDGMTFGEDPNEGYVRGRRFIHPGLAIAFAAPEGFALENTYQAVLGIAAGGSQALRFDGVELPPDQTLEGFFTSGWIEGLENGSIQTTTVNGLPAATATAKGKEWTFRLGAVRSEGTVYRLLYATRSSGPESERIFRETLGSIRRLSSDEVRSVKPWRINVVTAREGDTAERVAARMASDQALERFLVLNGLERGATLRPGQRYKIVAE